MGRLIDDRYFADGSAQAWDLATGQIVPADRRPVASVSGVPPFMRLVEILDQGQDGSPRSLEATAAWGAAAGMILRAAADGQSRGFVPVDVAVYFTLRDALDEVLRDRALLLIGQGVDAGRGWMALVDAAARSPRPHVLITIRIEGRGAVTAVRETRAAYGAGARSLRGVPRVDADEEHHLQRASRAGGFVRAGRHAAAERLLRDVAGALARRGRHAAACRVSIGLGQIVLGRGRAADADRAFGEAAVSAATVRDETLMAEARIWQAVARTDAGRLSDAESLCRAVLASETLDAGARVRARGALARVLLWQRRGAEAAALDLDLPDVHGLDLPAVACMGAIAVRVLIANGRLFDAGLRARYLLAATADGADAATRSMAWSAHLRVLVAAGDLTLAHQALETIVGLAKQARLPLRAARARLIWALGLLDAGRAGEARREVERLRRLSTAAPPLFRGALVDARRRIDEPRVPAPARSPRALAGPSAAASLVTLAHEEEDDREAVRRVLELVAGMAQTSRIDVCSADAGPVSTVITVGAGLPTRLGGRVLDAGIALGPEAVDGGHEVGVPARRGVRLFAAIVGRWPADRTPPGGAVELLALAAAVACTRIESMLAASRVSAAAATSVPELVGTSSLIADVRAAITRAASAPFAVLIQGESGVGKELVARAIHQLSPRRERRFCDVNCAALPDDLLESELFGHARGAFTGAVSDRPGLFEDADGGTVFLDELADLSPRAQAKLLRVLQQQEVRRVGETFSRKLDVRLVTAANRDMSVEAESGRFRQDLRYRLDVIRIRIPPLRERPGDVALLAEHFWQSAASRVGTTALLTHAVLAALARYHWPGNVRELQNVMSALAVAAPARGSVRAHLLPAAITGAAAVTSTRLADARAQFERRAIESALARAGGSRTRAARELGLSRQGLLKMMGRLGVP